MAADFASMLYGGAQEAAQNVGAGAVQGVDKGIQDLHQNAQLAIQKQQVDQQAQEIEMKKQQNQVAKVEKLYDYIGKASNYQNAGARNNYLKSAIGLRNTLGVKEDAIPDDAIMSLSNDENLGRKATLDMFVRTGKMPVAEAADLLMNPAKKDQLAQINPMPLDAINSQPDLTSAQQDFMTQQQKIKAENVAQQKADTESMRAKIDSQKLDLALGKNAQVQQKTKNAALDKAESLLESARGNPMIGKAQNDIYSANKLDDLFKGRNLNDLSPQEAKLAVGEVAKMATGGVPTGHEQEALAPGSAEFTLKSLYNKAVNDPTPANAGAYLQQLRDYGNKMRNTARDAVLEKYDRVIETHKRQLEPDDYKQLREKYIKPLKNVGSYSIGGHEMSISQMQQFAQAHPSDPALKFMQPYLE